MSEEPTPRGHEGIGAEDAARENRRALRPLLVNLDVLLDLFDQVEAHPTRRADDHAVREAIRGVRPALAKLRAALERMERPAGGAEATAAPADDAGLALVDQTFTPEAGEEAREHAEAEREGRQPDEQGAS